MTADLASRIATALSGHRDYGNDCRCGWEDTSGPYDPFTGFDLHQAEVIIKELGLTEFRVDSPVAERWWSTRVEPADV
jgi:hypothetical protein